MPNRAFLKMLKENNVQAELLKEFLGKGLVQPSITAAQDYIDLLTRQKNVLILIKVSLQERLDNESK